MNRVSVLRNGLNSRTNFEETGCRMMILMNSENLGTVLFSDGLLFITAVDFIVICGMLDFITGIGDTTREGAVHFLPITFGMVFTRA